MPEPQWGMIPTWRGPQYSPLDEVRRRGKYWHEVWVLRETPQGLFKVKEVRPNEDYPWHTTLATTDEQPKVRRHCPLCDAKIGDGFMRVGDVEKHLVADHKRTPEEAAALMNDPKLGNLQPSFAERVQQIRHGVPCGCPTCHPEKWIDGKPI